MKKYLYIASLFVLTACGGGSGGGGSGGGANMMRPTVTPREDVVRNSNLLVSSNIDNESRRVSHVVATLGESFYSNVSGGSVSYTRASRPQGNINKGACSNQKECNQIAFDNMKKWLIDNADTIGLWDESVWGNDKFNTASLRQALILAGFESLLQGNWDNIKAWALSHREDIISQATEIYNDIGTHKDFDITQNNLSVAHDETKSDVKIKFLLDKNEKITGIEYVINQAAGNTVVANVTGERIDGTKDFALNTKLYTYSLNYVGTDWDPQSAHDTDGGQILSFTSSEKLVDTDEIKNRFRAVAEYQKQHGSFFERFHHMPDGAVCAGGCNVGDEGAPDNLQELIADAVYADVLARINNLGTNEEPINERPDVENSTLSFESVGKELGLAYSDFGTITLQGKGTQIFHGGYDNNKIERDDIETLNKEFRFTGLAKGSVTSSQTDDELPLMGNATLVFSNTGTETLTANFSNWYDVTITQNGSSNSIAFNGSEKTIDNNYKFARVDNNGNLQPLDNHSMDSFIGSGNISNVDARDPVLTGAKSGDLNINYYGGADTPTEFSGYATYSESVPHNGDDVNIILEMGFGGKRQYMIEYEE